MSETKFNQDSEPNPDDDISVAQDDEVLVAYLDGELPREQRGELEQRLVNDESLRFRLQSFQKEWDLLNLLPSPETTEQTVQSTLELVVDDVRHYADSSVGGTTGFGLDSVSASRNSKPTRSVSRFRRKAWLIPVAFFAIAFAGVRWGDFRVHQTHVRDFPVAIDMEVYSIAEDTSLLEHLSTSTRWRRVVAGSVIPAVEDIIKMEGQNSLFANRDLTGTPPTQKQLTDRLGSVSTEERMIALSRLERFQQLDPNVKDSLRDSAQKLRQLPDAENQLDTLRAYARWREQLSDELVDAIETETGTAREEAIEIAIAETITSIGRATSRNLGNEAIERIDFTLIQIVKQRYNDKGHFSSKPGLIQRTFRQRVELHDDPDAVFRMVADEMVFQRANCEVPPLKTSELELIQAMLPTKDAETLQRYVDDRWVRALILEDWAQEAVRRKRRGQKTPPTLPEKYQLVPAEQKEVVDLMPPEKSRRWLMEFAP